MPLLCLSRFGTWLLVKAAFLAPVLPIAACGWWLFGDPVTYKNPERVFRRYEAELRAYVARLQAGKVQPAIGREPNEYCMPKFLIDCGATRTIWRDGRVVIMFFVSAVDAVPQLEYSPEGFGSEEIKWRSQCLYFKWVPLAQDWAACYWDS